MKKDKDKKTIKTVEKTIVNGLTLSRIAGTIAMPILYNYLSAPVFLATIIGLLLTDKLDGVGAKGWHVRTIFGSVADTVADKVFDCALLVILCSTLPLMKIPIALEAGIIALNIFGAKHGEDTKSSQLGRVKTCVIGTTISVLLLLGMAPELIESLENIKAIDVNNTIFANFGRIGESIINGVNNLKELTVNFIDILHKNKEVVSPAMQAITIAAEGAVAADYAIKYIKPVDKDSETYKWADLIKNRKFWEHVKKVILDEKYYEATQNLTFMDKITTPEIREEIKRKKLTPDNK